MISIFRTIYQSRRLRAATLAMFFIGSLAASIAPYQGLIAIKYFGLSDAQFALIMVIGAAVSVAVAIYIGIITDQWAPRRETALLSSAVAVFGLGLVYVTGSVWAYIVSATMLIPVGFSLIGQLFAIARVAVTERAPADRDAVMSYIRAAFALPFIVILPLWSIAFTRDVSLIHIYGATTLASLFTTISLWLLLPRDGTEGGTEQKSGLTFWQSMSELAQSHVLVRLVLISALVAANTSYMQTFGLIFDQAHPEGTARTARFAALVAGLEIPFMLMLPILTRRISKSAIFVLAATVYSIFLFGFPKLASGDSVWLLALPAAMGAAVFLSIPIAYFQDLLSDRPGASSSLQSVNQVASQIIAGSVFWVGTSIASYGLVMTIAAVLALLAGLLLLFSDQARGL